jgi:hypothetical protein
MSWLHTSVKWTHTARRPKTLSFSHTMAISQSFCHSWPPPIIVAITVVFSESTATSTPPVQWAQCYPVHPAYMAQSMVLRDVSSLGWGFLQVCLFTTSVNQLIWCKFTSFVFETRWVVVHAFFVHWFLLVIATLWVPVIFVFSLIIDLDLDSPGRRCSLPATTQTRSTLMTRLPPSSPPQGGPRTGHKRDAEYQVLVEKEKQPVRSQR